MKYAGLLMLFLMGVGKIFAQPVDTKDYNLLLYNSNRRLNEIAYEDIQGHPYSSEEMQPGTIRFISGFQSDSVPMRYNWYTHTMEVKPEDELLALVHSTDIVWVEIDGVRYIPFFNLKSVEGYLIELYKGGLSLFREDDVLFIDEQPAQSGYEEPKPAKFQWRNPVYRAILSDGTVIKLEQNKRKLPAQFPRHASKIAAHIKEQKLNPKKEEDLIAIIEFADGLGQ